MVKNGSLLIVDDNNEILVALEMLFSGIFKEIRTLKSPNRIPELYSRQLFDVVILDMNFNAGVSSGNEGIYWMKEILKKDPGAAIVLITAYGDVDVAVKAMREGATDFIQKPWDDERFVATVKNAYQLCKSRKEVASLKQKQKHLVENISGQFPDIIGDSEPMKMIFNTINKVAVTDANILITGENGTGKELVAREIHQKSKRADEVFVHLDIAALPDSLFESELFGYVKGAFTDAKADKPGRFEIASGGTLFLDEIGNLSLTAQSKLLTVLQNREIQRLGATYKIPVDIRLICATNKPLNNMVAQGEFREDLLYRINTIQLKIPSLRERKDDIPLLVNYFIKKYELKYNKPIDEISEGALKKLMNYQWPGNVRELQHLIEKAVIMSEQKILKEHDFGFESISQTLQGKAGDLNLSENEKNLIIKAIQKSSGNYTIAAKKLGISRKTLYNKLKRYDLE